jgi:H+-transporting ATPase
MAGMDVLCLDKTGTITQNKLTLAPVEPFAGFEDTDVLLFGTLASKEENQDPIDDAIIHKGRSVEGVTEAFGSYKVLKFKPFDPVAKRTEAIIEDSSGNRFKTAKGAPQIILSLVTNKEDIAAKVEEEVDNFAAKGYRTLGVARTDKQENWQYVGLIPLYDPPRDDSAETIKAAHAEGIEVKVITGDHAAITKEIGQQVNVGTSFLESLPPLFKEEMSEVKITPDIFPVSSFLDKPDREAKRIVEKADGFAQVFPEHKYAIVELLQSNGHIVGMTGDGVNDAPALKKADTGVAVAGATDAAKAAADIVLTSPGLSVILHAVEESRKIFQRMNSYALYRISETIRVLFFITASILAFNFYPITAMMIVLLALFNDAPIMTIAYDNVRYSNKPEKWNMPAVLGISTAIGLVGVFFSFGIFYIALRFLHLPPAMMQSFIFLKLAVAGHLTIFVTRTRGHFWSIKPSAALFWSTVITKLLATLLVVYGWFVTPIGWKLALFVWVYALIEELVITDWVKVSLYKMIDRGKMKLKDRMRMKRYFAN